MMSAAFKQIFLLTCLIVISGCRETLTGAIPPSTEKPTLKISKGKASQDSNRRTAPVMDQEDRVQIASVFPNELINASQKEVAAKLGTASLIRQERQSLTLQFKKEKCVLDVVLYGNKQTKRVKFVDLRDTEGNPASPEQCYVKFRN
tara:strand:- start:1626 stop:2066 length:441 start_codon:yes stop_codon:yes gene_type:complete